MKKKLFTLFSLLMVFVCGIKGQTEIIIDFSKGTVSGNVWTGLAGTDVEGYVLTCSNTTKTVSKGVNVDGHTVIKFSNGAQYSLTLPASVSVSKIKFVAYANATINSYLFELNGTQYATTDYIFPAKGTAGVPATATHEIEFGSLVNNNITFTFKGKESAGYIVLTLSPSGSNGLTLEDETAHNLIFTGAWDAAKFTELVSGKEVWSVNLTGVTNITGNKPTDISNPNCLYYVTGDLWENEVNVVNDDAKTAKSISLADGANNPFYNRVGFTATAATYTRTFTAAGTYSVCLPFAVASIPTEVTVLEYKGSNGAKVNFSPVSAMAANTPYLVEVSADNINKEIKFEAANTTVEASVSVSVADEVNNAYSFNSNFEPFTTTAEQGLYLLEAGGTGFVKAGTASVGSFRAYIAPVSNELAKAPRLVIGNDEGGATGIDASQAVSGELSVYSEGGVLELNSPVSQCVKVYGVDGRLVRVLQLSEGSNVVSGLAKGMYVIANRKVVVK